MFASAHHMHTETVIRSFKGILRFARNKDFLFPIFFPGLLWNLSSADNLKPDLLRSALPVLVERVIVPYAKDPDRTNDINPDSEVFFHTTGCLR